MYEDLPKKSETAFKLNKQIKQSSIIKKNIYTNHIGKTLTVFLITALLN